MASARDSTIFRRAPGPARGELLAERHARHRAAEPLLPADVRGLAARSAEVEELLAPTSASGAVAAARRRGRRLPARRRRKSDAIWGANVWVELAGHAVSSEPRICATSTRAAAARWVERGRASPPLRVSSRRRTRRSSTRGSGSASASSTPTAIRETPGAPAGPRACRLATARRPRRRCVELERSLPTTRRSRRASRRHASSRATRRFAPSGRGHWRRTEVGDLVAERDGRVVGAFQLAAGRALERARDLARSRGAASTSAGRATLPGRARLGRRPRADGARRSRWAHERGYETMIDRLARDEPARVALLAARGFRPTFLRLYRHIPCDAHSAPVGLARRGRQRGRRRARAAAAAAARRRSPTSARPSATRCASRSPAQPLEALVSRGGPRDDRRRAAGAADSGRRVDPRHAAIAADDRGARAARRSVASGRRSSSPAGSRGARASASSRRSSRRSSRAASTARSRCTTSRRRISWTSADAGATPLRVHPSLARDRPRRRRHGSRDRPARRAGRVRRRGRPGDAARRRRVLAARDRGIAGLAARRSRSSARSRGACR